ncbi:HAD family hydrolase [Zobellia galactanivorans]|uniref:HAD family hydrolase n=1 Tax=Zobellia galactanivorans (strain DSM 12802 / CCUG 47099 / CIP 106680 / NCIMB 13871 / Dsij) TaxID=63186 RepID=UPI0026E3B52B|nr:HAD family hydrolase [Zobellia galactanivorans]MDO6811307.1 HAD family hydrolase [Zobellia galactanivorans]
MKYKTLILDFDGTLADTKESIIQTMKFVAHSFDLENFDEKQIESLIGLPLKTTFEKAFSLDEKFIESATSVYRKHYNEIVIDTISLFDGVKELLSDFHHRGINLTVASSKGKEALIKILKKQNIYDIFLFVGGVEDAKNKKPSPDIVNLIMDKYNYRPNECLVVGDTIFDIEMGQRANVDTCGVTYGNNTREKLEKLKPNYIIDNFRNLNEIVK